jgi:hypothetical protein
LIVLETEVNGYYCEQKMSMHEVNVALSIDKTRSPWNILGSTPVERVITFSDLSGAVEIEAPQLTGNDILFGIEQGTSGNKTHYIYRVQKSIF